MKNNNFIGYGLTAFEAVLTTIQTDPIFQWISFALTIVSLIITIIFTVWKWYKEAKKDGKITKDEIETLIEEVKPDVDSIAKKIDNKNKEEK